MIANTKAAPPMPAANIGNSGDDFDDESFELGSELAVNVTCLTPRSPPDGARRSAWTNAPGTTF
jgi:hypothetical protein